MSDFAATFHPRGDAHIIGRGTLYHFAAYFVFFACGYSIHILLARALGVESYGIFALVLTLLGIGNIFVTQPLVDTFSKHVAEDPKQAGAIYSAGLRIQAASSLTVCALFFTAAPLLASVLRCQALQPLLRIGSVSILLSAIFSLYFGILAGLQQFGKRAVLLAAGPLVKLLFAAGALTAGFALKGVIWGYALSAAPVIVAAHLWLKTPAGSPSFPIGRLLRFAAPLIGANQLYMILQSLDLIMVQWLLRDAGQTGYYSAACMMVKMVPVFFSSINESFLPSLSRLTAEGNRAQAVRSIRCVFRYLCLLVLPVAAIVSSQAKGLLNLLYSAPFSPAAGALSWLIWGYAAYVLFALFCTVATGLGKPASAFLFGSLAIAADLVLQWVLVPRYGIGGAAVATLLAFCLGALVGAAFVARETGMFLPRLTLARTGLSAFAIYMVGVWLAHLGIPTIAGCALQLALYGSLLVVTGELCGEDLNGLKALLGSKPEPLANAGVQVSPK